MILLFAVLPGPQIKDRDMIMMSIGKHHFFHKLKDRYCRCVLGGIYSVGSARGAGQGHFSSAVGWLT